jgi:hypothetical protein
MNEYKVTIIGAGFESSSGWVYYAESPPAVGDEIEVTPADAASRLGDIGRERVRVEVIYEDGTISGETLY